MEENMNMDLGLQPNFTQFLLEMISRAGQELGPKQEISPAGHELGPEQENMNMDRVSQHRLMGVGAHHDDDIDVDINEEFDPAPKKNMVLVRQAPNTLIDFMGVGAQHGDDTVNDNDLISQQEPDPEQVHDQQTDSTCTDDSVEMTLYSFMQLLPTGRVKRDPPDDREVRLDLDMRLHPEISLRRLRQEGPESVTLQLGPPSI